MPVPPPVVSSPVNAGSGKRRRDPLTIVMFVAAFVALAGVAFAVGRVTAPAATTTATGARGGNGFNFPGGSFNPGAANGGTGGLGRFGGVSLRGTVTEATADHITLKLTNGTSLTIPVDANTAYHQQASATAGDVKSGTTVEVQVTAGGVAGGGVGANASGAPGIGGRVLGPASDITIVTQ